MSLPGSSFRRAISSARSPSATLDPLHSVSVRVLEKTTFGISFLGGANGSVDVGQCAAIS
jgi:hypothetical protein